MFTGRPCWWALTLVISLPARFGFRGKTCRSTREMGPSALASPTGRVSTGSMHATDEGLEILDEAECWRLMRTARVGRVAVANGPAPAVFPVAFVVVGSDILFFTGSGIKFDAAREGRSVSFEVDEIDAVAEMGWSVLAVGPIVPASTASKARAQALGLYPWAAGDRQRLLRIRPDFLSGRRILH